MGREFALCAWTPRWSSVTGTGHRTVSGSTSNDHDPRTRRSPCPKPRSRGKAGFWMISCLTHDSRKEKPAVVIGSNCRRGWQIAGSPVVLRDACRLRMWVGLLDIADYLVVLAVGCDMSTSLQTDHGAKQRRACKAVDSAGRHPRCIHVWPATRGRQPRARARVRACRALAGGQLYTAPLFSRPRHLRAATKEKGEDSSGCTTGCTTGCTCTTKYGCPYGGSAAHGN